MGRSKNHLLFELYLEELGETALFEATKSYSLGHIIKFVENYEELDGLRSYNIVSLVTGGTITSVSDMTNEDLDIYSSIKALLKALTPEDVLTLSVVFEKIDTYHEEKRAETT